MSGIDGYTKLMLHCDGTDGSTSFPDDSDSTHTVTAGGDAQVDTAQKVFGTGSALFDGTGDYLVTPNSSDFEFLTGDFTIDFRVRFNNKTGVQNLFGYSTSTGSIQFYWTGNQFSIYVHPTTVLTTTGIPTINLNQWYHVAFVRYGNDWNIYLDGTSYGNTTDSISLGLPNHVRNVAIGAEVTAPGYSQYFNGWIDEFRVSKGIARWTTDFTPSTSAYTRDETIDLVETVEIGDDWFIEPNPQQLPIDETVEIGDDWFIEPNPQQLPIDETVEISDSWTFGTIEQVDSASRILSLNPLIIVTNTNPAKIAQVDITDPANPTWTVTTLVGVSSAKDIAYDSVKEYFYVACANGKVVKVDKNNLSTQSIIDLSDTDDLEKIATLGNEGLTYASTDNIIGELYLIDERLTTILDTRFDYLEQIDTILTTNFNYINAEILNTNLQYLSTSETVLSTDFKYIEDTVTSIDPIARTDFHVYIDDVQLGDSDLDLKSITIRHAIDDQSVASFRLARNHDAVNTTLGGSTITIDSQNTVKIYIQGHLEFSGRVSQLAGIYDKSTEYVQVTALADQQVPNYKYITLSLPGLTESRNLYQILLQDIIIDNPYIDPNEENPLYYKGIEVDLGDKVVQNISRWRYIGLTDLLAEKIENGEFNPKQNWSYFWFMSAKNFVTGLEFAVLTGLLKYIGTSISVLANNTWQLVNASYRYQRQFDDVVTDLGTYQVGSAPYQSITARNGIKITKDKWVDKADGLYRDRDEGNNYEDYAKQVADLEYEKLQNINSNILPITSANLDVLIDAYYYYGMALLTRINIDNTTEAGIYKNNKGFPVSIKAIDINSNTMRISLTTDNTKSIPELEEIDSRYPNEESDEFLFPEKSVREFSKYDPNLFSEIE